MDPFRNGAAGVARSASPIGRSLNGSSAKLFRPEDFAKLTTPSAALSVASQLLVDAAATPPLRGGEYSTYNIFFNSFTSSMSARHFPGFDSWAVREAQARQRAASRNRPPLQCSRAFKRIFPICNDKKSLPIAAGFE